MQSKLPLLPSGPGGVRRSTFHGPWQKEFAARREAHQGKLHAQLLDVFRSQCCAPQTGENLRVGVLMMVMIGLNQIVP